jgi:hypothetical protein
VKSDIGTENIMEAGDSLVVFFQETRSYPGKISLKIVYFREPSKFICFMAVIYSAVATYVLREAKFLKQKNLLGSRK